MEKNIIKLIDNRAYGVKVSNYGLKNGYLDYRTLAKIIGDCILNNSIRKATYFDDWELVSGKDYFIDDYNEEVIYEVYQEFIISYDGYKFLNRYTDEIVYYNEELDVYLWAVTHFGTAWDYVLTDVKLIID